MPPNKSFVSVHAAKSAGRRPMKSPDETILLREKIDALENKLSDAIEVAYRHGAVEWAKLNHPEIYSKLSELTPADAAVLQYLKQRVDNLQDERWRQSAQPVIINELKIAMINLKQFTDNLRKQGFNV
tara:strand:+ start:949 stop:1332 length:384 start_codon:yes stop_codon:yes gene_type:complete